MPPTEAVLHANTIKSPITIRVFTPTIITPRQISAGMLSDGSLICLRSTAFPMRLPSPIISLGSRGFVPGQMYKSELKKGERAGPAYFGGCSSPFNQPVALSVFSGSGPSQSKHWNVRCPLPLGGSARIKKAPQWGQVGRLACPMR